MGKILIVDDEKSMRITLYEFLVREGYEADTAQDARMACTMLQENEYDVIVTDIIMPKMNGVELLTKIREKSDTIQIIVMTGEPSVDTAIKAVQAGANDYLPKPINKELFLKTIRNALQIKSLSDNKILLEKQNLRYQKNLEELVENKTAALRNAMQSIIYLLSSVVELRDPYTAGHQHRVGNLSAAIANKMNLGKNKVELIRIIGYIHDIGKIVIPTEILSKPGVLSPLEMMMIKDHPVRGYEMLKKVDLPDIIGEAVYRHHERFDGSGYPAGLKGDDIILEAQILMVADVVEAMVSHRPYRPALGLESALDEIKTKAGLLYNEKPVHACLDLFNKDGYSIEDKEYKIYFPI